MNNDATLECQIQILWYCPRCGTENRVDLVESLWWARAMGLLEARIRYRGSKKRCLMCDEAMGDPDAAFLLPTGSSARAAKSVERPAEPATLERLGRQARARARELLERRPGAAGEALIDKGEVNDVGRVDDLPDPLDGVPRE